MNYYHNLVTEKSWKILLSLKGKYDFILIGGWAVFLYTKALKSKDIDIITEYAGLEKIRNDFPVTKNDRLKKYEAKSEEVEIDIYLPFYSNLGIPVEKIKDFKLSLGGFNTVEKELLSIMKEKALVERTGSVKGRKDLIDLMALFNLDGFDWDRYRIIIEKYKLEKCAEVAKEIIQSTPSLEELGLNVHEIALMKKKILFRI